MKIQNMHIAAALSASLRGLVLAGLTGGLIATAAAPAAHADSVTTAQKASIPTATRAAGAAISREYLIKAALLYNFAKFAEWPATAFGSPASSLRICVIGSDPFGPALDSLNGKTVRNRTLAVTRIADVHGAPQCHVLFVSSSEAVRLQTILDYVGNMPILSVADIGRFTKSGGIIALKEVDNRSRIEINVSAAKQAGLTLSSKLLRLADTTDAPTQTGDASGFGDDVTVNSNRAM